MTRPHDLTPPIPPLQWERVCSDCWMGLNPTEYEPDGGAYGMCAVCLTDGAWTHGMRTREVVTALQTTGWRPEPIDDEDSLQGLIDAGMWGLEGAIGRAMMRAIESGEAVLGLTHAYDYWGNRIPSRFEVKRGTKGSVQYAERMRAYA